jgi:hypothetical protein
MARTGTYTQIATYTVTGSAVADYTFTSIPGTYTDLIFLTNIKGTTASAYINSQINADTAANYSQTTLFGSGTGANSSRNAGQTIGYLAQNGNIDTTNFTPYIFSYNDYSNTTTYKTWLGNCGSASYEVEAVAGLYRSTAAISSIRYWLNLGNIAVGTTMTLYGIEAYK